MARMMNKLFTMTGMQPSQAMQEAMRRMEAGEDPDRIDEEMGSILDAEEPMLGNSGGFKGRLKRYIEPPNVDPSFTTCDVKFGIVSNKRIDRILGRSPIYEPYCMNLPRDYRFSGNFRSRIARPFFDHLEDSQLWPGY